MNEKHTAIDWKFWRRWVLFSTIGYAIGGVTGWFMAFLIAVYFWSTQPYSPTPVALGAAMALGGVIAGTAVGLVQWQAVRLKASYDDVMTWMTTNVVVMAISWALAFWGTFPGEGSAGLTFSLLMAGVLWGFLSAAIQWYLLGEQVRHTALWLIANTLCGMLVFVLGWVWTLIPLEVYPNVDEFTGLIHAIIGPIISWPIAGLLYGLMTGTLLAWLLRESKQPVGSDEHVLAG